MSKTFTVMKSNVGKMVQDTSSALAAIIGNFINDGYQKASRRYRWDDLVYIDYTFESVVGQNEYTLPTDFEEELYVTNIAQARRLKEYDIHDWWSARHQAYNADSIPNGTPSRYMINREASAINLDPAPDTAETYAMPYKKTVTDLSDDSDVSKIINLEPYLEAYAISQTYAYKKQFQKADYYLNKAEMEFNELVESRSSAVNKTNQIVGMSYNPSVDDNQTIGDSNYGI